MAGSKTGGKRAAQTIKERYGEDFYQRIGKLSNASWEKNGRMPRGFAANPELASLAGRKAGKISKRGHTFMHTEGQYNVYIANDTGKVVKYKHGNNYFEGERGIAR